MIALKRRGVDLETRTAVNKAFKILTSGEYNTSQAIEKIRAELPMNEYIENMINFIESSKRGVVLRDHSSNNTSMED